MEPRPGLEPGTCRFLQAYRGAGSKGLFPHPQSQYSTVFGSNCSQVVRKILDFANDGVRLRTGPNWSPRLSMFKKGAQSNVNREKSADKSPMFMWV
jgi:hypothetical protein